MNATLPGFNFDSLLNISDSINILDLEPKRFITLLSFPFSLFHVTISLFAAFTGELQPGKTGGALDKVQRACEF